jgi:hypothetical protein
MSKYSPANATNRYTEYSQKFGSISHFTRGKRTPSASATVQVSHVLPAVRFSCLCLAYTGRVTRSSKMGPVKANKHTMPLPCRFKCRFTQTMPFPCRDPATTLPLPCHSPTVLCPWKFLILCMKFSCYLLREIIFLLNCYHNFCAVSYTSTCVLEPK